MDKEGTQVNRKFEIKPKIGLGTLLFGSTMQQVKQSLGLPDETEVIDEEEGYKTQVWHYWNLGFSLFFDESESNLFSCVEIENEESTLWGEKIFSMNESEILKVFKTRGFVSFETEQHEWGEKRISFEDLLVDLYFEKNRLVSVNFGAIIDREEIIFWPN